MMMMPPPAARREEIKPPLLIRRVGAHNYISEFRLIDSVLDRYPYIAIDTDFPGTYFESSKPYYERTAEEQYSVVKYNVDRLHLIQLGMSFFDAQGNRPDLGTNGSVSYAWEFNFSDFNLFQDPFVPQSIDLLINGVDLLFNRDNGIPSCRFGHAFLSSRLALSSSSTGTTNRRWVSFQGGYDFAYLVKVITHKELPETLAGFMEKVKEIFGPQVYDIKNMIRSCNGLFGGLERVAEQLRVEHGAGRSRQAGSDSHLTALVFSRLVDSYFPNHHTLVETHAGRLYGLV